MLNEYQTARVWEHMIAAETRALYFGDLTSRYTRRKQFITGLSFFLSSGAAATIIAETHPAVPAVLAILTAGATAYAIATNLDGRIRTMATLHSSWNQIAALYDRLWNHTADADAEEQLSVIMEREREPSELATTSAPNDEVLMAKWQDRVFAMYHLPTNA
jgi:hypothetical protein